MTERKKKSKGKKQQHKQNQHALLWMNESKMRLIRVNQTLSSTRRLERNPLEMLSATNHC